MRSSSPPGDGGAGAARAAGAVLRSAAAHVFVADVAAPEVADEDQHHLARSLRLRAGEVVTVSDGAGSWRACRWVGAGGRVEPAGDVVTEPRPAPLVAVGFALVKGERPEWAVQKLAEVGVDVVVPFVAARSVVRWDGEKAARNAARLARVAREAAMQSRRVWLPEVRPVAGSLAEAAAAVPLAEPGGPPPSGPAVALAEPGDPAPSGPAGALAEPSSAPPSGPAVALAEPGGPPLSLDHPAVLVGPEGGWSEEELASGLATVGVGPAILRAETATAAVGVLLCALRARIVRSHDE